MVAVLPVRAVACRLLRWGGRWRSHRTSESWCLSWSPEAFWAPEEQGLHIPGNLPPRHPSQKNTQPHTVGRAERSSACPSAQLQHGVQGAARDKVCRGLQSLLKGAAWRSGGPGSRSVLAVSHGARVDTGSFLATQAEGWLARQRCHGGQGSGTGSRLGCDRTGGMKWRGGRYPPSVVLTEGNSGFQFLCGQQKSGVLGHRGIWGLKEPVFYT